MDNSPEMSVFSERTKKRLQLIRASRYLTRPQWLLEGGLTPKSRIEQSQHDVGQGAPSVSEPKVTRVLAPSSREIKIRQLVDANAGWSQLEPHCWELFDAEPNLDIATKVAELVLLFGFSEDYLPVFARISQSVPDFYRAVHKDLRRCFVLKLWQKGHLQDLLKYVVPIRDFETLTDLECLAVFCWAIESKNPSIPYAYYQKHNTQIMQATREYGERICFDIFDLSYFVGKICANLGFDSEAAIALKNVSPKSTRYSDSLHLLGGLNIKNSNHTLFSLEKITQERNQVQRIQILREYLQFSLNHLNGRDESRPALNLYFSDPEKFLDDNSTHWEMLSRAIYDFRQLRVVIPNIFSVYFSNDKAFNSQHIDRALWLPWLNVESKTLEESYIKALANLRCFVHFDGSVDKYLWKFREIFLQKGFQQSGPQYRKYNDLLKDARDFLSRTTELSEESRQIKLKLIRLAQEANKITSEDIESYLATTSDPDIVTLREVQSIAENRRDPKLAYEVALRIGVHANLTNNDIGKIWLLSNKFGNSDLAWRAATLAKTRSVLDSSIVHSWEISGEFRSQYPDIPVNLKAVESCLYGFTAEQKRLAMSIVTIGPKIPELLACLDDRARELKRRQSSECDYEKEASNIVQRVTWLQKSKYRYRFVHDTEVGNSSLPGFVDVLMPNTWSYLVARLSESLGINSWGWKVSTLYNQISEILPKMANHQTLKRNSSKVAKWLRSLSSEERVAWRELSLLIRQIEDEEAENILATFVTRLATLILPNHFVALTSLKDMRAGLNVINSLEIWIMSPGYTTIRESFGIHSRVPIPNALKARDIIK